MGSKRYVIDDANNTLAAVSGFSFPVLLLFQLLLCSYHSDVDSHGLKLWKCNSAVSFNSFYFSVNCR